MIVIGGIEQEKGGQKGRHRDQARRRSADRAWKTREPLLAGAFTVNCANAQDAQSQQSRHVMERVAWHAKVDQHVRRERRYHAQKEQEDEKSAVLPPAQAEDTAGNEQETRTERPEQGHAQLDDIAQGRVNQTEIPDRVQVPRMVGKLRGLAR